MGGGEDGDAASVTVNGGYLYAAGGEYAPGIGGGEHKPGGYFRITGGRVNAYGGKKDAGIGGAEGEAGGSACIEGGTVLAGSGADHNFAFGAGKGNKDDGTLKIADGMCVRADSDWDACRSKTPVDYGRNAGPTGTPMSPRAIIQVAAAGTKVLAMSSTG